MMGMQFDVGVAHALDVSDELVGEFAVGEERVVFAVQPAAEVDFVDRHRLLEPVAFGALLHPRGVVPLVACRGATTTIAVLGGSSAEKA